MTLTTAQLKRVHAARLQGTPLKHIAESFGYAYRELSREYSKWRKENDTMRKTGSVA